MRYDLAPIQNLIGDMSGVIGNFCDEFIGAFYSKNVSRKANIVITELFDNAVSNNIDGNSKIILELKINQDRLHIRVKNAAKKEQYRKVKKHVKKINSYSDPKILLADTIRERRKERLKGGLGLIRLTAENKFKLSVKFRSPFLIMDSEIALGGLV